MHTLSSACAPSVEHVHTCHTYTSACARLQLSMHTLSVEHMHTYQTYISACAHSQLSMCTGCNNKHSMFVFVTQKFVFVTQIIVFVTQKKKLGYKKERVTKKNVFGLQKKTLLISFLLNQLNFMWKVHVSNFKFRKPVINL